MMPHIRLVKQNLMPKFANPGWGNGYVVIPKGHQYHGLDTDELNNLLGEEFFLPISYAEAGENGSWVIGFDTMHMWCNSENCTLEKVEQWAEELLNLIIKPKTKQP